MRVESPSPAPISSFRVIYKMERECAWCLEMASKLAEAIFSATCMKNGICCEAISLTLRTSRKCSDMTGNATF